MNPIFLTLEEVLEIHGHQIELHGSDPGEMQKPEIAEFFRKHSDQAIGESAKER